FASSGPLSLCCPEVGGATFQGGPDAPGVLSLERLRAVDLERPGLLFEHGEHLYRTTGEQIGHGGMGNAFVLGRRLRTSSIDQPDTPAVGKVFHSEYLYQLRTDPVTRRDHEAVLSSM